MPFATPAKKKEYQQRYYARNRETFRVNSKAWRSANPDICRDNRNSWREKNPEKYQKIERERKIRNRDKMYAATKRWAKENPEKNKVRGVRFRSTDTYKAYVERTREHQNRLRRERYYRHHEFYLEHYRQCGSKSSRRVALMVKWEVADRLCYICGTDLPQDDIHFDHVLPRDAGGSNDACNLMPTHSACNKKKSNILGYPAMRWDLVAICTGVQCLPRSKGGR